MDFSEDRLRQAEASLMENLDLDLNYRLVCVDKQFDERVFDRALQGLNRFSVDFVINAHIIYKPRAQRKSQDERDHHDKLQAKEAIYENF